MDLSVCPTLRLVPRQWELTDILRTMNSVFGPGLLSVRGTFLRIKLFSPVNLTSGFVGKEHQKQRKQLNPVFSVRYLRDMVPMFNKVAQEVSRTLSLRSEIRADT